MKLRSDMSVDYFNRFGAGSLPALFGLKTTKLQQGELVIQLDVQPQLLAPNGYLHAATIIALADSGCGYACKAHLPEGAVNFTTIELKSNFLGTARSGTIEAVCRAAHLGRSTHVWDATVTDLATAKTIALFRCTQMVLWPKASPAS